MTVERMADHWWWRPGWYQGQRMFTWHFTFQDHVAIQELAATYQTDVAGLPGLDLIPAQWLHLTTQGLGFTDEISDGQVAAVVDASTERLRTFTPQTVTIGPARLDPEAILLDVAPVASLTAVRDELRAAITGILGSASLMDSPEWTPHVSVAYSSGTAPSAPYVAALSSSRTAECVLGAVELITINRDRRMYEWTTRATVPLGERSSR